MDEFLRVVLDRLEEEAKASATASSSTVPALLKLTTANTVTCTACKTVSLTPQSACAPLTVPIPMQLYNSGKSSSRSRAGPTCYLSGMCCCCTSCEHHSSVSTFSFVIVPAFAWPRAGVICLCRRVPVHVAVQGLCRSVHAPVCALLRGCESEYSL